MTNRIYKVLIVGAIMWLSVASAYSGPCSNDIAQFESAVRQSASNPNAGPTLPQSVGAQIDRQPMDEAISPDAGGPWRMRRICTFSTERKARSE
jgi:hypothetical protein